MIVDIATKKEFKLAAINDNVDTTCVSLLTEKIDHILSQAELTLSEHIDIAVYVTSSLLNSVYPLTTTNVLKLLNRINSDSLTLLERMGKIS